MSEFLFSGFWVRQCFSELWPGMLLRGLRWFGGQTKRRLFAWRDAMSKLQTDEV